MTMLRLYLFALIALSLPDAALAAPALIPMPRFGQWQSGALPVSAATTVQGDGAAAPTAAWLASELGLKTGAKGKIRLGLVSAQPIAPNPEAYRLRVTPKGATIAASDPKGLFYGAQTLRQLVADDHGRRSIAGRRDRRRPALRLARPADRRQPPLLRQARDAPHSSTRWRATS